MKKLFSLVIVLTLQAATPAYAESFLPTIPTEAPAAQSEYVPSYAACMGVSPDQEFTEDGYLYLAYSNVTEENYNQYGSYLQERGYCYTQDGYTYDYETCALAIELTNGSTDFIVCYLWESKYLVEGYPEGITPEPVDVGAGSASTTPKSAENSTASPDPTEAKCKYCGGTGICDHCVDGECEDCFGDGSVCCAYCLGGNCMKCGGEGGELKYVFGSDNRWVECSSCGGSGDCRRCDGTGEQKCTTCNGYGDCKYCKGTSDCSYCQ